MRFRRHTYLPITSIVIGIVILAVAVAVISYRDIRRGREQVSEILWHRARGQLAFAGAVLRAELVSPIWRPDRISALFEEISASSEGIAYIAILDENRRAIVHSDPSRAGTVLPEVQFEESTDPAGQAAGRRTFPPGRGPDSQLGLLSVGRRMLEEGGKSVYEYRIVFGLIPPMLDEQSATARGRSEAWRSRRIAESEVILARLSEFLGTDVSGDSAVRLTAVVGLDATDLEAAFSASRNYTLLLSAVLLLVGGAAIYFLFMVSHYRSTRTALENMRSYTSNIIESMASGLVSLGPDGRVATVNTGARSMLGLGPGNLKDRALEDVLKFESDGDRASVERVVDGTKGVLEKETRVVGRSGVVPVALSASSLRNEEGERTGTVLLFQDLREIEELKEAVERERHLASLGRLAAGVAHEVRNPLSSLKGFAQFFRSKFAPGSEEERYSDIMIEEVERLDRVVHELLDFARPVTPDRAPVSANTLVEEALSLVSEDAQFRSVEIDARLAEGLPDVFVDSLQMRQALLNVLLNALEAMPEGGRLTIETSGNGGEDAPPAVTISVSDSGVGMSEDEVSKLFEPFYTTKPKGTGLGLTVVSRVLEQNGGRISVRSVKGEGTIFSLVLPVAGRD